MKHTKLITDEQTSKRMKALSHKKSKVESILAKALWHKGYRYRLNYSELPGTPDIAIAKYRIAIFVDGEFWHGKDFNTTKNRIHNNKSYWIDKISENMERDRKVDKELFQLDWTVLHFWSKDVINYTDACVQEVEYFIEKSSIYD